MDAAAQRVDEIVDGAERVASEIIAEAEAEADQYLETRRNEVEQVIEGWSADLRGLAELLSRQEDRLRKLTESMISELEDVAAVLGRIPSELEGRHGLAPRPGPAVAGPSASPPEGEPPFEEAPEGPPRDRAPDPSPASSPPDRSSSLGREGALLRAAQMAVAGSSREEIEDALRDELSVGEPAVIVDDLFGPRR